MPCTITEGRNPPFIQSPINDFERNPICFIPDWCIQNYTPLQDMALCLGISTYNFLHTNVRKLSNLSKVGKIDNINEQAKYINRVQYLTFFFMLWYAQYYLNDYDSADHLENYITKEELKCIRRQLECQGVDIECILKCVTVVSESCRDCYRDNNIRFNRDIRNIFNNSSVPFDPIEDNDGTVDF